MIKSNNNFKQILTNEFVINGYVLEKYQQLNLKYCEIVNNNLNDPFIMN